MSWFKFFGLRTFALRQLENLIFLIQITCWGPRFYWFRALGALLFSLEHSLGVEVCAISGILPDNMEDQAYMLQVKIKFRLKYFNLG